MSVNEGLAIGIDIGGTNIRTALIKPSGEIIAIHKQPTHADLEIVRIIENIANGTFQLLKEQKVKREKWKSFVFRGQPLDELQLLEEVMD